MINFYDPSPRARESTRGSALRRNDFPGRFRARARLRIGNEEGRAAPVPAHEIVFPHLKDGAYPAFAHGFTIRFGTIVPPSNVNILTEIQNGTFAQQWVAEHAAGKPAFVEYRKKHAARPIQDVGRKLRGLMPWMRANQTKPEPVEAGGTADHGFRMM